MLLLLSKQRNDSGIKVPTKHIFFHTIHIPRLKFANISQQQKHFF